MLYVILYYIYNIYIIYIVYFLWREICLAHEETVRCALCALETQCKMSQNTIFQNVLFCVSFLKIYLETH
jgi:hypothetical protein